MKSANYALWETTPSVITPDIHAFIDSLGAGPSQYVPVIPIDGGRSGWCHTNVAKAVAQGLGEAVHGRTIWACKLFATAEYHVVLRRRDGALVDVTPTKDGELTTLFAPDPAPNADFDFMQRPPNRRVRLYHGPSAERRAADLMDCMPAARLSLEIRRARKAGVKTEEFVASRMGRDTTELAIDRFLDVCGQAEAMLRPTPQGQWCDDIPRWRALEQTKNEMALRLARTWSARPVMTTTPEGDGGFRP